MSKKEYGILFLCTGNSCRSIMAEAVLQRLGDGRFRALSAGSFPLNNVDLATITMLEKKGYDTTNLYSKSWSEFDGKPGIDIVVTVCDQADNEECPVWFGDAARAHWNTMDPSAFVGNEEQICKQFEAVLSLFEKRIGALIALPIDTYSNKKIEAALAEIGSEVTVAEMV